MDFNVLEVHGNAVVEARNLSPRTGETSKESPCDPYCVVSLVDKNGKRIDGSTKKTHVVKKSTHPVWDVTLTLPIPELQCESVEVSVLDRDRSAGSELIGRVVLPLQRALGGVNEWLSLDGGGQIFLRLRQRTQIATDDRHLNKCDRELHKHFAVDETEHVTHEFRCALVKKRGVVHAGHLWFTPHHLFFYSTTAKVALAWKDIDTVIKGKSVANTITFHTRTHESLKFCHFRARTECLLAIEQYLAQTRANSTLVSPAPVSSSAPSVTFAQPTTIVEESGEEKTADSLSDGNDETDKRTSPGSSSSDNDERSDIETKHRLRKTNTVSTLHFASPPQHRRRRSDTREHSRVSSRAATTISSPLSLSSPPTRTCSPSVPSHTFSITSDSHSVSTSTMTSASQASSVNTSSALAAVPATSVSTSCSAVDGNNASSEQIEPSVRPWSAANPPRTKPKFQEHLSYCRSHRTPSQRLVTVAQHFCLVWSTQLLMVVLLPGVHVHTILALAIVTFTVSGFNVFALPALIVIGSSLAQYYQSRSHRVAVSQVLSTPATTAPISTNDTIPVSSNQWNTTLLPIILPLLFLLFANLLLVYVLGQILTPQFAVTRLRSRFFHAAVTSLLCYLYHHSTSPSSSSSSL
jgi:hypothetical protein